jgi:hypothetical protein
MPVFTAIGMAVFGPAVFTGFFATPFAGQSFVEFDPSHKG